MRPKLRRSGICTGDDGGLSRLQAAQPADVLVGRCPGIITANADNDVGGVLTYSQAGAQFGYTLLWLLIPVTIGSS